MLKARIVQDGTTYMIQTHFYSKQDAQGYIDSLIEQSEKYIAQKLAGKRVAPLMTVEKLQLQLENIKKFKIVEYED